jgi:hypothetical protein
MKQTKQREVHGLPSASWEENLAAAVVDDREDLATIDDDERGDLALAARQQRLSGYTSAQRMDTARHAMALPPTSSLTKSPWPRTLADHDSPIRPDRSIKMGLYLYINVKFNGPNTLLLSWGDRAAARYGPQDGPPLASDHLALAQSPQVTSHAHTARGLWQGARI